MSDRWATFDCYGTLIDWNLGIGTALGALFPASTRESLLELYHTIEPEIEASTELPYRDVLARCVLEIAKRLDMTIPPGAERLLGDSLASWPPFEEVPGALRELKHHGWKTAVLSNTDPDLLGASLATIGVPVDLTITHAETGSYKPAPGHWEHFFEKSNAERNRHVHVAASLFHDIEPCARFGFVSVWVNRLAESSALPRAAELPDLRELPATLDAIVGE